MVAQLGPGGPRSAVSSASSTFRSSHEHARCPARTAAGPVRSRAATRPGDGDRGPRVPSAGLHRRPLREHARVRRPRARTGGRGRARDGVHRRAARRPGAPGGAVRRARGPSGPGRRGRHGRGQLSRSRQGGGRDPRARRPGVRLLRRAPRARSRGARRRPAHHGRDRLGSDARGRPHRSRARQQGGHLQPLHHPPHGRVRPGAHARVPAGAHRERGRRRPVARDRGVHSGAPSGDGRAGHRARLRGQERTDRHLRPR